MFFFFQSFSGQLTNTWCPVNPFIFANLLDLSQNMEHNFTDDNIPNNLTTSEDSNDYTFSYDLHFVNQDILNQYNQSGNVSIRNLRKMGSYSKAAYCYEMYSIIWLRYLYLIIVLVCSAMIAIGNFLILVLPFVSKSFDSPIFATVNSFAGISFCHGIDLLIYSLSHCSNVFTIYIDSNLQCLLVQCIRTFIRNVFTLHLSLLAFQRIFIAIFPLKARIYHTKKNIRNLICFIYVASLFLEPTMAFLGVRQCRDDEASNTSIVLVYVDFMILNGITIISLALAMLVMAVKSVMSSNLTTSTHQRSQSRIASFVIITYIVIYCPLQIYTIVLQTLCQYSHNMVALYIIISILQFIVHSVNPILFCLRLKEVRNIFLRKCC